MVYFDWIFLFGLILIDDDVALQVYIPKRGHSLTSVVQFSARLLPFQVKVILIRDQELPLTSKYPSCLNLLTQNPP